ncbi:MAG: class I SAM-dependent methyltransferase [bacterium]|nr:class I SAM-dependent methyltransferase [bacterium]
MKNDNSTPMSAGEYDKKIANTIPYYEAFNEQTFDVIEQCNFEKIHWLDLGCGTGSLAQAAFDRFENCEFVLVDPAEKMLDIAREKMEGKKVHYYCTDSASIDFQNCFEVVTAIQSHHYMQKEERRKATENVFKALKAGGIYISFENVVSDDASIKSRELSRWGAYQQRHGKSKEESDAHLARCGTDYFPITVEEHMKLLIQTGFAHVHVFWYSYMQMGIYAIK